MLYAMDVATGSHSPVVVPGLVVAGAGLLAAATVAGAWLAWRRPGQQQIWFGAAAGALLVIAGLHILPDAWSAARAAGIWPWAVPTAAIATYLLAGVAARGGCACRRDTRCMGGAGAAAALAAHRFLEGSALALVGSATVVAALAVHALGEGLAVGALLLAQPRRRAATWLAVMCVSPVAGVLVTNVIPLPVAARPLLLALAGGVLAQAARVSLRAACHNLPPGRLLFSGPAAATTVAAAITVLAVHAAG
jgi:zinc transporter ZupT